MLNAVNNYNVLGRLGPHYERPEYRPQSGPSDERDAAQARGDRQTLSSKERGKKAPAPVPANPGRLNLASARNLARNLAAQIVRLPPHSTDREPHTWLRASLLTPVYV